MSKQSTRRAVSPRRPRNAGIKTGSKKDNLPSGYKPHENAAGQDAPFFIPKIKEVK
jgi:hypothetical protein